MTRPHLRWPVVLAPTGGAAVVEEDTDVELVQSVAVLVTTERGTRRMSPRYGVPPVAFVDVGSITSAVEVAVGEWEPRADARVSIAALTATGRVDLATELRRRQ
jgi:phage baseplate assembly protein W